MYAWQGMRDKLTRLEEFYRVAEKNKDFPALTMIHQELKELGAELADVAESNRKNAHDMAWGEYLESKFSEATRRKSRKSTSASA